MALFEYSRAGFTETNGRRIGTRITLVNSVGYYMTLEFPIVENATVYWAAHAAKKALNIRDEQLLWFIERYDAINDDEEK